MPHRHLLRHSSRARGLQEKENRSSDKKGQTMKAKASPERAPALWLSPENLASKLKSRAAWSAREKLGREVTHKHVCGSQLPLCKAAAARPRPLELNLLNSLSAALSSDAASDTSQLHPLLPAPTNSPAEPRPHRPEALAAPAPPAHMSLPGRRAPAARTVSSLVNCHVPSMSHHQNPGPSQPRKHRSRTGPCGHLCL